MNAGVEHVKVTPDLDSSNAHSGSDFLARWESSGRRTWYIYSLARIGGICRPDRLQNRKMSQDHAMTHEHSKVICEGSRSCVEQLKRMDDDYTCSGGLSDKLSLEQIRGED